MIAPGRQAYSDYFRLAALEILLQTHRLTVIIAGKLAYSTVYVTIRQAYSVCYYWAGLQCTYVTIRQAYSVCYY